MSEKKNKIKKTSPADSGPPTSTSINPNMSVPIPPSSVPIQTFQEVINMPLIIEYNKLLRENESLRKTLTEMEQRQSSMYIDLMDRKSKLELIEHNHAELMHKYEDLIQRHDQLVHQHDELVKINAQLIAENTQLKETISLQQKQLTEHQTTISTQQQQLTEHQTTISTQQHQLTEHQTTISTQQHQLTEHQMTINTQQHQLAEHQETISAQQQTISLLHQQVDQLTQWMMKTDNDKLFRKLLIAIQDLNRHDSLEKEYSRYRLLPILRITK